MILVTQGGVSFVHGIAQRTSTRTLYDHDVRQFEQALPFMPCMQLQEGIAAHQQAQRALRAEFAAQRSQRVHRVTGIGAMNLAFIQNESGIALQCQTRHIQPLLCAGVRRFAVRWGAAGNKMHGNQTALLQRLLRQTQMPVVDRVEGAAEDADGCDAHYAGNSGNC